MIIGIVSGYFNPLHYGHVEYMNGAKERSDRLICIINSDHQVSVKGSRPFMDEVHRAKIVSNLKAIDETLISIDKDGTVSESLRNIRKAYPTDTLIFFNSGDRKAGNLDTRESQVCKEENIRIEVLDMPKIYSSSDLLKQVQ